MKSSLALQNYARPPRTVGGDPAPICLGEVVAVNDKDGTVDIRPLLGRASKSAPYPSWYQPKYGDHVLYTDLHGDPNTPIVVAPMAGTTQADRLANAPRVEAGATILTWSGSSQSTIATIPHNLGSVPRAVTLAATWTSSSWIVVVNLQGPPTATSIGVVGWAPQGNPPTNDTAAVCWTATT